jgi:hypothetical protein
MTRYRIAGFVALLGLAAGYAGGALMHFPPFPIQRLVRRPIAGAVVSLLALGTVGSLALWARRPDRRERRLLVVPISILGGMAVMLNVLAPALGFWGGPVFEAPLLPLALLTGLRAMVLLGLPLLLYRRLAARRVRLARGVYLLILLALAPATILGDEAVLRSGVLTFGNGYTIWTDLVLGEIFFAMPPVLYEIMRRARGRAA